MFPSPQADGSLVSSIYGFKSIGYVQIILSPTYDHKPFLRQNRAVSTQNDRPMTKRYVAIFVGCLILVAAFAIPFLSS